MIWGVFQDLTTDIVSITTVDETGKKSLPKTDECHESYGTTFKQC